MNKEKDGKSLKWYVLATSLGSIIARLERDPYSIEQHTEKFNAYDACHVIRRPSIVYEKQRFHSETKDGNLYDGVFAGEQETYTSEEAHRMGYVDEDGKELVEIEGESITDYIAIRPDSVMKKTAIIMTKSSLVHYYELDTKRIDDINRYVDKLMGRAPSVKINTSDQMIEDFKKIT